MAVPNLLLFVLFAGTVCAASPSRIVGGESTTIETYPSLVQVDFLNLFSGAWSHSCAANILNSRYLLSAAHCFDGWTYPGPEYRRIRAGSTYRGTGGEIVYITQAFNHPTYGTNGYDGDITVVLTSSALVFSSVIAQATIVPQGWSAVSGLAVVVAGWGATSQGGSPSDELMAADIFIVDHDTCRERYAAAPWPANVTENMICAGLLDEGGKDACNDDSGGPLYIGNIIVGIISWAQGCAQAEYPGVNTAVSSYTDWILSIAQ